MESAWNGFAVAAMRGVPLGSKREMVNFAAKWYGQICHSSEKPSHFSALSFCAVHT
jgi:hypothetical protein